MPLLHGTLHIICRCSGIQSKTGYLPQLCPYIPPGLFQASREILYNLTYTLFHFPFILDINMGHIQIIIGVSGYPSLL